VNIVNYGHHLRYGQQHHRIGVVAVMQHSDYGQQIKNIKTKING
jgi:hypothetical protein